MSTEETFTKQKGDYFKIRSVSDGTRMGVGPHANQIMTCSLN
jgi:hypothetical protein